MKQSYFLFRKSGRLPLTLCLLLAMMPVTFPEQTCAQARGGSSGESVVRGKVVDSSTKAPLVGASVWIKGTQTGAVTNSDGTFSIAYKATNNAAVLDVSFIGYEPVETRINGRTQIDISLLPSSEVIDELVVVGYGVQKKATLTGAISSISSKDIVSTKNPSLAVALAGKIPGLMIRQTNGLPGAFNTNISMRGQGTPMFVIDGAVRNDAAEFQKLNPEDIESITVLKDASAAIYGINSSNGVMVITTKNGSQGPIKVSYNMLLGFSKPTRQTEMLNSSQYWEMRNEKDVYTGGSPYFATREALEAAKALPTTDWYGEVFKNSAFQQSHNITIEGGTEKIAAYASLGYQKDYGLLRSNDISYDKYSLRTAATFRPSKDWKIEVSVSGYRDSRKQPGTWGDAFMYINKSVHGLIPSETVYANNNPDYYNRPASLNDNPVLFSQRDKFGYREWDEFFFQSSASITYSVPWVKGLNLKVLGAYDRKDAVDNAVQKRVLNYLYSATTEKYTSYGNYTASINEQHNLYERLNMQAQVIYNTVIANDHSIDATLVFEGRKEPSRYLSGQRYYNDLFFTVDNIDMAPELNQQAKGNTTDGRYLSVVGRLNYNYKSKYLVELAFREDGSYRYNPDSRWGFFPVASVGWRISEEFFIKNSASWISNLKIRASYGKSGEDAGNPFQFVPGYKSQDGYILGSDGKFTNGYVTVGMLNENLTWVTSKIADIGIDADFWNGKLGFTFDVYRKDRSGLLATRAQALPNYVGATLPEENLNADRNEGFDMSVSHNNTVGDFYYGVTFNMNFNRAKMTRVERADFRSSYDRWRNGTEGRWTDIGWGFVINGQYQNYDQIRNGAINDTGSGNSKTLPGDYIREDVNGDGVINGMDMQPLFWVNQPKINFGLSVTLAWKGIDFNMQWHGAAKYTVYYNGVLGAPLTANDIGNGPAMYYDRWHLADPYDTNSAWVAGEFPAVRSSTMWTNEMRQSRRINASYARLKNIELGYTFPSKWLRPAGISKLRVYFNAFNPLMICNSRLKGFDPELNDVGGLDYPLTKSFNFGLNITF